MTKKKILVADDDENLSNLIRLVLKDYDITVVLDGIEAWDILQQEEYDLLITDLSMPGLGGFELCLKIRQELSGELPIIAMSGSFDQCREMKDSLLADVILQKPFSFPELKKCVDDFLNTLIEDISKKPSVERDTV